MRLFTAIFLNESLQPRKAAFYNSFKLTTVKKILFILSIFSLFAFSDAQAQRKAITLTSSLGNVLDTVDNTETVYLTVPTTTAVAGRWSTGTFIFETLEISGDGSGAVASLQVKVNGKWATVPVQITADTAFTIANVTTAQTYAWRIFDMAAESFRIKVVGAGTMSYKVSATAYLAN